MGAPGLQPTQLSPKSGPAPRTAGTDTAVPSEDAAFGGGDIASRGPRPEIMSPWLPDVVMRDTLRLTAISYRGVGVSVRDPSSKSQYNIIFQ